MKIKSGENTKWRIKKVRLRRKQNKERDVFIIVFEIS
jgi:hypothetical protein